MAKSINMTLNLKDNGVSEADFNNKVEQLAVEAYGDQNIVTNPSAPLIKQIEQLMKKIYVG